MNRSIGSLARIAVIVSVFIGLGTTGTLATEDTEVVVASGTLSGRVLADALFHIGEFWMRVSAPSPTPATTDVIGRLPAGNLPFVHILFLKDELSGSLGPITFETADSATATKFDAYDDTHINIVIKIE